MVAVVMMMVMMSHGDGDDDDADDDGAGCLHIFEQHMACTTSHDIISLQCIITWRHSHSGFVDPSC